MNFLKDILLHKTMGNPDISSGRFDLFIGKAR